MPLPDICRTVRDEAAGVTYEVYAFREIDETEAWLAIRSTLAHVPRRQWPRRGQTRQILTVLGAEES